MAISAELFDDWFNNYHVDVFEDWGQGFGTGAMFTETMIGTKDGKTVFENQEVLFTEVELAAGVRRTVGECSGIWHKLKIVANQVGSNFHLKLVEFNYILTGRW